jgi:hypothetical protein
MAKTTSISLGTDPEVFLVDSENLALMPLDIIADNGGSTIFKDYCISYELKYKGFKITEDGAAFELNVKPGGPAEVAEKVVAGLYKIEEIKPKESKLIIHPIVNLHEYDLIRPEISVLGCSPDRVVGGEKPNKPEQDPTKTLWRTGGGHVHFGIGQISPNDAYAFIKACDTTLGLYDVCNCSHCLEDATQRRKMYGQAGRFRFQKWGIEYRTPSNQWLRRPDIMEEFLHLAHKITENDAVDYLIGMVDYPLVARIINNNDLLAAREALSFVANKFGVSTRLGIGG